MMLTWAVFLQPKLIAVNAAFQGAMVTWAAATDGASSDTLKVALVGGVTLILSTTIPSLVNSWRKSGTAATSAADNATIKALIDSNNQRRREYTELAKKYDACEAERNRLENVLWRHGIDPETGESVRPSEQAR